MVTAKIKLSPNRKLENKWMNLLPIKLKCTLCEVGMA